MEMSGFFDVLQDASSDESTEHESGVASETGISAEPKEIAIPSYEDLSSVRIDEETVLSAVYGDDFFQEVGAWGCKKLNVLVKPPDVEQDNIGNQLM